jgi:hypothetical protein
MPLDVFALHALIAACDRLASKDAVIDKLAESRASEAQRKTAYRMWASAAGVTVYRSDVERAGKARRPNGTPWLFD